MSEAGIDDPEQAWPSTNLICWPTMRLATATACFGSQASSSMTILIFLPLTPPASLIAWAAASAPRFIWSPIEATGPVIGPATAMVMSSARAGVASAARATPESDKMTMLRMFCFLPGRAALVAAGAASSALAPWHGLAGNACDGNRRACAPSAARHPAHSERWQPRLRAQGARDRLKTLAFVKAPGAKIVLVDVEFDDVRGEAFRRIEESRGEPRAELGRRDAELVEIAVRRIERDEARRPAGSVDADYDRAALGAMGAQALVEPGPPRLEVDREAGLAPGRDPELDEGGQVGLVEVAQCEGSNAHRSVSFSSMRRLRASAASSVPWSIGWNSPNPAAASRSGSTPLEMRYCTTATARAADSSQFDPYCPAPVTGRLSVCPSTLRIQGMSGGISRSRSSTAEASVSSDCLPSALMSALPTSNSTEDSNTNLSPTTLMSGREPRICRRRPKKSER